MNQDQVRTAHELAEWLEGVMSDDQDGQHVTATVVEDGLEISTATRRRFRLTIVREGGPA